MPFEKNYEHAGVWQLLYAVLVVAFLIPCIVLTLIVGINNIAVGAKIGAITSVISVVIVGIPIGIYRLYKSRKIAPLPLDV